jgi:hypothetical protein
MRGASAIGRREVLVGRRIGAVHPCIRLQWQRFCGNVVARAADRRDVSAETLKTAPH